MRGEEVQSLRQAVVSGNQTRIVMLDLSGVEAIDAGGVGALLSLRKWTREYKVQLKLVNPSHFVQEVLERTQLDRIFDVSRFDHALLVLSGRECRHAGANYAA